MSDEYEPELGQAVFGQPHKQFKVPEIWDAALEFVRHTLDTVMMNITQKRYDSPFGNHGNSFKCEAFEVCSYSWADEEQPFNFKWRDVEISWYKYLGRGMSANKKLTPDLAAEMLSECTAALWKMNNEARL